MLCCERVAVDAACLCLQKDEFLIGRELVSVYALFTKATCCRSVEKGVYNLAVLE